MKKIKARRKVREPRFCFKTLSDVDVLDDGYKWRKYGQKVVKEHTSIPVKFAANCIQTGEKFLRFFEPRSYYRCTQDNCRVKKRVERLAEDPRMVITTYEGRHAHSPPMILKSHKLHLSLTTSSFSMLTSHLNLASANVFA
ncbi:WRKY transcription factor [Populus alba x Populus x berolinensis]|nr:WRKY transcription factor [Populus alba x Populus x berolinensis]